MLRLRFALIFLLALVAASASVYSTVAVSAHVTTAAPALQATTSIPTPAPATSPQSAAPIGEGTQQALLIVTIVVLSGLLIGGGIYLRRRWMATRY